MLLEDGWTDEHNEANNRYLHSLEPPKTGQRIQNIKCERQSHKDMHKQHGKTTAYITPNSFPRKKGVGLLDQYLIN